MLPWRSSEIAKKLSAFSPECFQSAESCINHLSEMFPRGDKDTHGPESFVQMCIGKRFILATDMTGGCGGVCGGGTTSHQ